MSVPKYFTDIRQKHKRHGALYASEADSNSPIQPKLAQTPSQI